MTKSLWTTLILGTLISFSTAQAKTKTNPPKHESGFLTIVAGPGNPDKKGRVKYDAAIKVTPLSGDRIKIEYCSQGQLTGGCTPLGPNAGGIYTSAQVLSARKRMHAAIGTASGEILGGLSGIAVTSALTLGATAWGGPMGLCFAVVPVTIGIVTVKSAEKGVDSGNCYAALSLMQKDKSSDDQAMQWTNRFNAAVHGNGAMVMSSGQLSQTAARMNQLLNPDFKGSWDKIDPNPGSENQYHVPGDGG